MKRIVKVLLWIWQLPQNVLGILFMLIFYRPWHRHSIACVVKGTAVIIHFSWSEKMKGGVTLGEYIFVYGKDLYHIGSGYTDMVIKHEYGHVRQSRMLGPLYLIVIGIPSLLHAAVHDSLCRNKDYKHFYTEKGADKLAGLK